ncbi:MAG: hypothetical protein GXO91_11185 [FCB group bacterium]|nr:hypothetical protein [FCB group bacterium]
MNRTVVTLAMDRALHKIVLIWFIFAGLLSAAGTVTGTVTYVTSQSFYTDLGKKDGISIGDTLAVVHESSPAGTGLVTNLSTNSSVCSVLENTAITVGDIVSARVTAKTPEKPSENAGFPPARKSWKQKSGISGSLSVRSNRSDVSRDSLGTLIRRDYALLNLSYSNILGLPLSLSVYARTRYSSETTSAGIRWYRMKLHSNLGPWTINGGRVYLSGIGGAGAIDGLDVSRKFGNFNFGLTGGTTPVESGTRDPKFGGYVRYTNRERVLRRFSFAMLKGGSGNVTSSSAVTSLFLQPWSFISLNSNTIIDLPSGGQSAGISAANLYLDFHWSRYLRGGISLNYTSNNRYYPNGVQPDTVYKNLARTNGGARLSIRTSAKTTLTLLANLLTLENQSTPQQNYRLSFDKQDLFGKDFDWKVSLYHVGGVFYKEYGGSTGAEISNNKFDIYSGIQFESYNYGIGGQQKTRKTLDLNANYQFLRVFNAGLYFEYAVSDDEDLLYSSAQLTYRFRY